MSSEKDNNFCAASDAASDFKICSTTSLPIRWLPNSVLTAANPVLSRLVPSCHVVDHTRPPVPPITERKQGHSRFGAWTGSLT